MAHRYEPHKAREEETTQRVGFFCKIAWANYAHKSILHAAPHPVRSIGNGL